MKVLGDMGLFRVSGYRLRTSFRQRCRGYLAVSLLVGLTGGLAIAAITAARLTQSSYPSFLASTTPSALTMSVGNNNGSPAQFSPALTAAIARQAGVASVASLVTPAIAPLKKDGSPDLSGLAANSSQYVGSADSMFLGQDRMTLLEGRMANPARVDQAVMTASAGQQGHLHIGQVLHLGYYTGAQLDLPAFGTPSVAPRLRLDVRLVGVVVLNRQVVQDDVDRASGFIVFTPALIRAVAAASPGDEVEQAPGAPALYGIRLTRGDPGVAGLEGEVARLVPRGSSSLFNVTSRTVSYVELAVKPESVALGAFGAIAGLVSLVIGAQAMARQVRRNDEERQILRFLGAGPAVTVADGLPGVLGGALLGVVLAFGLAVALSPLDPLGPVRAVYPDRGVHLDWTVLGVGMATLAVGLCTVCIGLSILSAPHRVAAATRYAPTAGSAIGRAAASSGVPVTGVIGVHFALESGRGSSVPARSALLGIVLAVVVVVSSVTFGAGLSTLVSHPALYGWNWSYMLNTTNDVPPQTIATLSHDREVASWTGADIIPFQIDGQYVPGLVTDLHPAVAPPILTGHGLEASHQIVLGSATLALLHKRVGDRVYASFGTAAEAPAYIPATALTVVGTATFPAIGYSSIVANHPSMGTGALLSRAIEPRAMQLASLSPDSILNGPQYVFVRLRPGLNSQAGLDHLKRVAALANKAIAADANAAGSDEVQVLGVQRPAQIVNYRTIGATPIILAGGLAAGAVIALGLTLAASVRRRRRDLALLKCLGLTQRQLSVAISWQASVIAGIGIIIGMPLGIVLGRQLWVLFADNIDAVPDPTVPALTLLLTALAAFVFANLVAAVPGRTAARTPAELTLRSE